MSRKPCSHYQKSLSQIKCPKHLLRTPRQNECMRVLSARLSPAPPNQMACLPPPRRSEDGYCPPPPRSPQPAHHVLRRILQKRRTASRRNLHEETTGRDRRTRWLCKPHSLSSPFFREPGRGAPGVTRTLDDGLEVNVAEWSVGGRH